MSAQARPTRISAAVLCWYDAHARHLPWRARPGARPDPYHVWLSEIMLQQTTVQAVKPYFEKFVGTWPTVGDLARADLEDILKAWAGLGYYARARNLHKCARVIAGDHGGTFPADRGALEALPGIGAYTSAAIAAIAFGACEAAVDGNVERVIARLFALETPLPDVKPQIRKLAEEMVPEKRPGDHAQAMMDLGATVCAPRRANCLICPCTDMCKGRAAGLQDVLPYRRPKAPKPTRYGVAFWVEREDGAVLLRRRPEKGLLGGMSEVPSTEWVEGAAPSNPQGAAPLRTRWHKLPGVVRHTFTHFHLELEVWKTRVEGLSAIEDGRWTAPADLQGEALPSVMRKVAAHALGDH